MALQTIDATTAVGSQTYAQAGVDTDGCLITGPPGCAVIFVRITADGMYSAGVDGADEAPIDADVYLTAWERSDVLPSSPRVFVKPSTGTASVYAVVR